MSKRQLNVFDFIAAKKGKKNQISTNTSKIKETPGPSNDTNCALEDDDSDGCNDDIVEVNESPGCSTSTSTNDFPDCWTTKQASLFKSQYNWLQISQGKLGCAVCSSVQKLGVSSEKHVHLSKEWSMTLVCPNGTSKVTRQASLRKKLKEHASSQGHQKAEELNAAAEEDLIGQIALSLNNRQVQTTVHIFNTVYSLVKRNRPMLDIEGAIELQIKNGVDVGNSLHSRMTATRIVEHIAKSIRKQIFDNIIKQNAKVCIIIDEASTISKKSTLIIYLQCAFETIKSPVMLFLELKELEETNAESIFNTLLQVLEQYGFNSVYLENNLVGFCSDGANVMLCKKSGVAARLSEKFPSIIKWHCLNHRLQLSLDDAIKEIKQVNHFKIFLDKIYTMYHQSNKNQYELRAIAEDLEIEIVKIGRVLGPRWVACSSRAVTAVWRAYPVLYNHFVQSKNSGMANRLSNLNFLKDLALMKDILAEFAILSTAIPASLL